MPELVRKSDILVLPSIEQRYGLVRRETPGSAGEAVEVRQIRECALPKRAASAVTVRHGVCDFDFDRLRSGPFEGPATGKASGSAGGSLLITEATGSGCVPLASEASEICSHMNTGLMHPVGDVEALIQHIHST